MTVKNVKQALVTGVGEAYIQFLDTEETTATAPVYGETTLTTPSIDKVQVSLEIAEKKVYASNLLHSDISAVKAATITLDALYLPTGFAEEAQGMVKIGGGYSMPTKPKKKLFRLAFPITDENGDALVLNFPKCSLSPVDVAGETEREDFSEQMQQFNIYAMPLVYKVDDKQFVYHKLDMAEEKNKTQYDLSKLLSQGWYNTETLEACKKEA